MYQNFKQEDRAFVKREFAAAKELVPLLIGLDGNRRNRALSLLMHYRYHHYDLRQPFMEQYYRNQQTLVAELKKIKS